MSAAKIFLKILAASFRHKVNWNPRGIGSNERSGCPVFFNFLIDLFLDVEVFHDHFNGPVVALDPGHIIGEVSEFYARGKFFTEERCRVRLQGGVVRTLNNPVLDSRMIQGQPFFLFLFR